MKKERVCFHFSLLNVVRQGLRLFHSAFSPQRIQEQLQLLSSVPPGTIFRATAMLSPRRTYAANIESVSLLFSLLYRGPEHVPAVYFRGILPIAGEAHRVITFLEFPRLIQIPSLSLTL